MIAEHSMKNYLVTSLLGLLLFAPAALCAQADAKAPEVEKPKATPDAPKAANPQGEKPAPEKMAPPVKTEDPTPDEIADSTGKITKTKLLGIGDTEILVRDALTGEDKKLSTENLIFARLANGKYYFFFPPEDKASAAPTQPSPLGPGRWELTLGVGMHYASNSDVAGYASYEASELQKQYTQSLGSGFLVNDGSTASPIIWQIFAEPRLNYQNFALGFSAGYVSLGRSSSVVNSSSQQISSTVNMSGMFFPLNFYVYYRYVASETWGVNLGFGAGALYSALQMTIVGGPGANEQVLTSLMPMLAFKPEVTYKFGSFRLLVSLPIYWAPSGNVTDGSQGLWQTNSQTVVNAGLTGVGLMLAVGYEL